MQGFYNITTKIRTKLESDPLAPTVTYGDIFDVDLSKQTIFPLCHLIVNGCTMEGTTLRFNISVIAMDVLDQVKQVATDNFIGNNNEQDIMNSTLAILVRLLEDLRRGDMRRDLYVLVGSPTFEPFTERFENDLAGWVATFDVDIVNDMTICN